jgi:hypothetical protein
MGHMAGHLTVPERCDALHAFTDTTKVGVGSQQMSEAMRLQRLQMAQKRRDAMDKAQETSKKNIIAKLLKGDDRKRDERERKDTKKALVRACEVKVLVAHVWVYPKGAHSPRTLFHIIFHRTRARICCNCRSKCAPLTPGP